ncbi:hypothetical protein HAALTHF_10610n [Vreelandella aquamarina]|nr:hypothetical protein HAALTHF_10610n [Halomonas axialensis]
MQPVGQLDDDDADIPRHRQHHLLEILRLGNGLVFEGDLRQLGDAIYQLSHRLAKLRRQSFFRDAGVFNHIMQHGGHQALMVHVHVSENISDRQRMGDVRLARAAALAIVGLLSVVEGALDLLDLIRGK